MNRYLLLAAIALATGCNRDGETLKNGAFEPRKLTPETIKRMVESTPGDVVARLGSGTPYLRIKLSRKTTIEAAMACGKQKGWWTEDGRTDPAEDLHISNWPLRVDAEGMVTSMVAPSVVSSIRLEALPVLAANGKRGEKVTMAESSEVSETSGGYLAPVTVSFRSGDEKAWRGCGFLPEGVDHRWLKFAMNFYKGRESGTWFPHQLFGIDSTQQKYIPAKE